MEGLTRDFENQGAAHQDAPGGSARHRPTPEQKDPNNPAFNKDNDVTDEATYFGDDAHQMEPNNQDFRSGGPQDDKTAGRDA